MNILTNNSLHSLRSTLSNMCKVTKCKRKWREHARIIVCRLDSGVLTLLFLSATIAALIVSDEKLTISSSSLLMSNKMTTSLRSIIELSNLVLFGFFERWFVLELVHFIEEFLEVRRQRTQAALKHQDKDGSPYFERSKMASTVKGRGLPLTKGIRDKDFASAQSKPWLHNKFALMWTVAVLLPLDLISQRAEDADKTPQPVVSSPRGVIEFSFIQLIKSLTLGLLIIDLVLGTAHMLSHKGPFQKYLYKFHSKHHSRHHNYSSVKYVGNPFDLEVFLTQVLYAFLPRIMGLDVVTGIILINLFSLQLLLEHSGYTKIFSLSQHHEAHHRFGDVAFYHFPLVELFLGNMPSLEQQRSVSQLDVNKESTEVE